MSNVDKEAIRANVAGIAEFDQLRTMREVIARAYSKCEPTQGNMVPATVREMLRNYGQFVFDTPSTLSILREAKEEYAALLHEDMNVLRGDAPLAAPADAAPKRWALKLFAVANARIAAAYALAIANAWADLHDQKRPERYDVLAASLGTWAAGLVRVPSAPPPPRLVRDDRPARDDRPQNDDRRRTEGPRKSGRRD